MVKKTFNPLKGQERQRGTFTRSARFLQRAKRSDGACGLARPIAEVVA